MENASNVLNDTPNALAKAQTPFVSRYLDALDEIKFKLAMKKIEGAVFIKKSEFSKMVEEEVNKDLEVKNAIDELFKPLNIFNKNNDLPELPKSPAEIVNQAFSNDMQSVADLEKMIDKEIKEESGNQKGAQKFLSKPGFKANNSSNENPIN